MPDETVYLSLRNSGLYRFDGAQWASVTPLDGLGANAVPGIAVTADSVWFAALGGLSEYRANPVQ